MAGLNQIKALNFHPQIILPAASHPFLSNSNKIQPKTAREENLAPIFVAWEQVLIGSAQASIQTAATKVTNIGARLSSRASVLLLLLLNYSPIMNAAQQPCVL